MAEAEEEEVEVEVEVPVRRGQPEKAENAAPPEPPSAAELLEQVVFLNRQRWWPPSRAINVDAVKALRTVSAWCAFRILEELEEMGAEESKPSVHIHQAVKRALATGAARKAGPKGWTSAAKRRRLEAESAAAEAAVSSRASPGAVAGQAGRGQDGMGQVPEEPNGGFGKGKGKGKGKGRGKGPRAAPVTRAMVGDKIQELVDQGVGLNVPAVTALFKVSEQIAMAVLHEVRDRALTQDPSRFVLDSIAKEEKRSRPAAAGAEEKPSLPNPELFKLRFANAVKEEEARKGKKGRGKGGKGKGKEQQ